MSGLASGNSGRQFGTFGSILSGGYGAGVFGTVGLGRPEPITGRYAGYFQGNVKVTGTIDGTLVTSSDGRLKDNVELLAEGNIRGESTLTKLGLLTPVSYNYKDTTTAKPKTENRTKIDRKDLTEADNEFWNEPFDEEFVEEPNQVMEKRHFGFIAQELQEVYPDLVYQKDDGYLAVNYTELIPILVQSIKELNEKVEMLSGNKVKQSMAAKSSNFDETASMDALDLTDVATMNQNVPNPFTEKTDIAIYLPETVKTATLYIYDLSGKQLEQHPIKGRGNTVMTIHADRMDAGMYVYSLIADKKVVTTKKMIVVK
ncbi:MAG: tail fiber domain-containing protein [Prevotella sp.]|nr:tail fiber domain-containing protein [Prevotella sp.]